MKEYIVCYTLENDVKKERILKDKEVHRKEIVQEVLEKILKRPYFTAKTEQGVSMIPSAAIRYVRVL